MPNKFKYNKTGSEANSIFKGNWAIDTTPNNIGDGPSSVTSFYNGAAIPAGGYTIYSANGVFAAANDTQLLGKLNSLGAGVGSASAALTWAAAQSTHMVLNEPVDNIITNDLVLNLDATNVSSFVNSEPTTNLIPNPTINAYPTTGNGWGSYNTNQYCGNNGCAVHWDIPAIASVSNNIVTTASAHPIRSFDVITPLTSGGGVSGGANYLAKKISDTQFSLHDWNSSQDGSQGYLNPTTGRFKVHDSFYLDQRVAVNASSFPTKWWGSPHLPNSGLVKEIITGGFNVYGHPVTDCIRLHWHRPDGVTDGMSYGVDASVTIGQPVTTSFWVRAASASAVGQYIAFQHYNYGGIAGASGFSMNAFTGAQGEWVRCSFTFTPTHSALISYWFPNTGNMKIDVANIQIEQKSSITPFVAGARSQNTTWYDLSGNNNSGSLVNGPTFSSDNGGSIVFDGTNDYIDTGKTAAQLGIYDADYTFDAWVYPTSLSSDKTMFGTDQTVLRQGLHLVFRGGTIYQGHYSADFSAGSATLNAWNNISYTYVKSSSLASIYKNGVLQGSGSIASFIGTTNILIGRWATNYYFIGNGSIYKIYNRALSASEVLQNFNANKTRYGL